MFHRNVLKNLRECCLIGNATGSLWPHRVTNHRMNDSKIRQAAIGLRHSPLIKLFVDYRRAVIESQKLYYSLPHLCSSISTLLKQPVGASYRKRQRCCTRQNWHLWPTLSQRANAFVQGGAKFTLDGAMTLISHKPTNHSLPNGTQIMNLRRHCNLVRVGPVHRCTIAAGHCVLYLRLSQTGT